MKLMRFSEIENHLKKFKVGIAGAGGLGSNCAAALARTGVGTLLIADFDKVELSNISRQFYFIDQVGMMKTNALKENLKRIRPEMNVVIHQMVLSEKNIPSVFRDCQVIVEAFDRADMKQMLVETVQKELTGIPLIVGSGLAGWGNTEILKFRKIDETLFICGDEMSEATDDYPPLAPRVCIVASMQANAVIEILMRMS
jgi:sulfur carrier protein ThiS adenylyltransferase